MCTRLRTRGYCVDVFCLCVGLCATYMPGTCGGQKCWIPPGSLLDKRTFITQPNNHPPPAALLGAQNEGEQETPGRD